MISSLFFVRAVLFLVWISLVAGVLWRLGEVLGVKKELSEAIYVVLCKLISGKS